MTPQAKFVAALYALWFVALLVVVARAGRIGRGRVPRTIRFAATGAGVIGVLTAWAFTWQASVFIDTPGGRAQCIDEPAVAFGGGPSLLASPDCVGPLIVRALELAAGAGLIAVVVIGLLTLLSRRSIARAARGDR